jgi:hypothetical protein
MIEETVQKQENFWDFYKKKTQNRVKWVFGFGSGFAHNPIFFVGF